MCPLSPVQSVESNILMIKMVNKGEAHLYFFQFPLVSACIVGYQNIDHLQLLCLFLGVMLLGMCIGNRASGGRCNNHQRNLLN